MQLLTAQVEAFQQSQASLESQMNATSKKLHAAASLVLGGGGVCTSDTQGGH